MVFSRDCQYLRDLHMHEPRHTEFPGPELDQQTVDTEN